MHTYSRSALVLLTLLLGTSVASAWTGPTQSPPNGNVSAPVNVGSTGQSKNGYLGINESSTPVFPFEVNGSSLLSGSVVLNGSNLYLNFGGSGGSNGYGIRDSGGTMQYKNAGGSWTSLTSGTVNTDTLDTVTGRGNTTSNWITVGSLTSTGNVFSGGNIRINSEWTGSGTLNMNSNQVWTDIGYLYLDWSAPNGGWVTIGGQSGNSQSLNVPNGQICLNGSCLSSWPSNTDTLDTVTGRGNTTGNYITVGAVTVNGDWFHVNGSSGIYWNTWQGGWYMSDGTWVRSANGKNVYTAGQMRADGGFCIGGSCITSWPSAYSNTDTLDTVTGRGNTTSNWVAVGNLTVNQWAGESVEINSNQVWNTTNGHVLYLNWSNANGSVAVGGQSGYTNQLSVYGPAWVRDSLYVNGGNILVQNNLGINGNQVWTSSGPLYINWQTGNGMDVNGNLNLSSDLVVQNNLNLNGNQMWTTSGNLYLNWSNPGGEVDIGNANNMNNNLRVLGRIGTQQFMANSGYPSGWAGGIHTFDMYAEGSLGLGSGGALQIDLTSAGNGYFSGTLNAAAFLYNSDERLKKNIEPLTDNLAKVLAIQPVSYNWINPKLPQTTQIGFIAQQVQKIVPELVYTDASTSMEAVDYIRMTPLLVGADQELNQKIVNQQAQIDAQQAEIEKLQSEIETLQKAQ